MKSGLSNCNFDISNSYKLYTKKLCSASIIFLVYNTYIILLLYMKFNRTLQGYITKYRYSIPPHFWFDYKKLKKQLKCIKNEFNDIINNNKPENDECCICLEGGKLMHMFCCKQYIHHKCLINVFAYSTVLCPLCRANVHEYMASKLETKEQKFNAAILSLLSNIYINIIKIENIYNRKLITNPTILQKYCHINYTAIVKICKKIKKCLHIDIQDFYINIVNKNGIIKPPKEREHHYCIVS